MAKVDRKKLLKQPDEFLTFSGRAIRWGKQNLKMLTIGGSALVLAIAVTLGIQTYLNYRASQAGKALAEVYDDFVAIMIGQADAAQAESVATGLGQVVERFGATEAGMQARLALGELWLRQGQPEKAEKALLSLSEEPYLPAPLAPLALAALGRSLEQRQKLSEAAEAYANAAKAAGPSQAALFRLDRARVLEAGGDKAQAEALYRELLRGAKDPLLSQTARQRLVALGLEPGPETPPAAPEPAPQPAAK
ncbi:MAG: tetratricopeptide repeat protein [Desulfarculus sp.]|nr:tetratricopeptide repeat protein [Desulfarculus sp.]